MAKIPPIDNLDQPVTNFMRKDFIAINAQMTVRQALESIRNMADTSGNIIYFYVKDPKDKLIGIVQSKKLLISPIDSPVESIMSPSIISIPDSFTLLEACEYFAIHKFLAFPVVDKENRIVGIVDVGLFTEEVFDIEERQQAHNIFETLGVQIAEIRDKSAFHVFRYRFPWLLATITSGSICAFLTGFFELTLSKSLILAFFLTLMLGLGESISMQTMAITIHVLHQNSKQKGWYVKMLKLELIRTFLLAVACSFIVFCIAFLWRRELAASAAIALSILGLLMTGCFLGVSVPALLHKLKIDVHVASGPVTLALADICTILIYFSLASLLL